MTNLFDILINAPKGLELYTPVFGKVYFQDIEDNLIEGNSYPIIVNDENNKHHSFTENGEFLAELDTECVLFPSKKHRTWDNWQSVLFQVGDIVTSTETENTFIIIFKNDVSFSGIDKSNLCHKLWYKNYRYATLEEREQFMAELNANDYKWNADTKQMEKIEQQYTPKYKVGDWLYDNDHGVIQITDIIGGNDGLYCFNNECQNLISLTDKFSRLATEQELIDARIKEKPFTINDFKPFDKVLVRDASGVTIWQCELFQYYNNENKYQCFKSSWWQCIPYNDETKYLLGTTDDCPKKYKTW